MTNDADNGRKGETAGLFAIPIWLRARDLCGLKKRGQWSQWISNSAPSSFNTSILKLIAHSGQQQSKHTMWPIGPYSAYTCWTPYWSALYCLFAQEMPLTCCWADRSCCLPDWTESRGLGLGSVGGRPSRRRTDTADWESTPGLRPVRNNADQASICVDRRPRRVDGRSKVRLDNPNFHGNGILEYSKQLKWGQIS